VLEVQLVEHFRGAPRFANVVAYMAERGFVPYDIVGGYDRAEDGALVMVDVVFVSEREPSLGPELDEGHPVVHRERK
jgi:hypothetical protein